MQLNEPKSNKGIIQTADCYHNGKRQWLSNHLKPIALFTEHCSYSSTTILRCRAVPEVKVIFILKLTFNQIIQTSSLFVVPPRTVTISRFVRTELKRNNWVKRTVRLITTDWMHFPGYLL